MTITFHDAMYLCALAFTGGAVVALAARQSIAAWREAGDELDADPAPRRGEISHMAPHNFRPLTPGLREKLRQIPGYAEMEDIKTANFSDAERMRRRLGDPARPTPIMAGIEPLQGEGVVS